ncbi:MAG: hypothetical protein E7617_05865 [Ruminococcaceae bacterium]|nr:hypothetical protein [Oscillospiraceae bacterium]
MKALFLKILHSPHFKRNLIIVIASLLTVSLTVTGVVLIARNPDDDNGDNSGNGTSNNEKQVPIYQGMTISGAKDTAAGIGGFILTSDKDDLDYDKDNGNHNGHFKGDHTGKDTEIDEENPFPDNSEGENIEEEIKSSLDVTGALEDIYYASTGEDIYIHIHISNPDNFEIMSFTLNDKKYSSYMFEEGSDMETIILKYNVGNASGVVEYTIDAIKYVDGTEIKDVIIDGDKTVKAGVRAEGQMKAEIISSAVTTESLSLGIQITDKDSLVSLSGGALKAVLYDGANIVGERELVGGENSVIFDGLSSNTVYQYAVIGYYDDLSGLGFGMNLLYADAFCTEAIMLFDGISVDHDGISFAFLKNEDNPSAAVTAMKLYHGGSFMRDISADTRELVGLLSNNSYTLVAEYTDGERNESISLDFTTAAKAIPDFGIESTGKTKTSLSFSIAVTDTDFVGAVTKVELIRDGKATLLESASTYEIADLLSDCEYTLRVTYTYDLNDGNDNQQIVKECSARTDAYAAPEIGVTNAMHTDTTISFELTESDPDGICTLIGLELGYKNGTVQPDSLGQRSFTGLLTDTTYTIRATYTFDLNDGAGTQTKTAELAVTTDKRATPELTLSLTAKDKVSLSYSASITDTDSVGELSKVEVVKGTSATAIAPLALQRVTDLLSDNEYTIRLTYSYDLGDGEGVREIVREISARTDAKAVPELALSNTARGKESLAFSIGVTDTDSVGKITRVELVRGSATTLLGNDAVQEVKNLLSDSEYTLRVTYTYDLNDGTGAKTLTKDLAAKTDAKTVPDFFINNVTNTQSSIGFSIAENDVDDVGAVSKIELLHTNGNTVAENADVRGFTGLLSDNNYTVKVTYTYDLNDGNGAKTIVKTEEVRTSAKTVPSITFDNIISNSSSISFGINEVDTDNVGEIVRIDLMLGADTVRTDASGKIRIFEDLLSNTEYSITVTYKYNLGNGARDVTVTKTASAKTKENNIPYINISGGTQTVTSVGFSIEESDTSNIGSITKIELYLGERLVSTASDTEVREFQGLLSNTEYTVKVTYVYNLGDGNGDKTEQRDIRIRTTAMAKPSVIFESTDRTKDSVSFTLGIVDVNEIGRIERIELIKDGDVVTYSTDAGCKGFSGILSDTCYTVKVIYAYDLNEGNGIEYVERTADIQTYPKTMPEISVHTPSSTQTSIGFAVTESDEDNVGELAKIELIHANGNITADSTGTREFSGLLSDNTYTVRITYTYDLNNGRGTQSIVREIYVNTLPKAVPEISLDTPNATKTGVSFGIFENDADSIGAIAKIELLHKSGTVTAQSTEQRAFENLLSNNTYTVRVTYVYNLNDGTGDKTITCELAINTLAKETPDFNITNTSKGQDSLDFSIGVTDTDKVGAITKVELIHGGEVVKELEKLTSHKLTDLLSDNEYTVRVTYTYDLNDGMGAKTLTKELAAKTDARTVPEISMTNTAKGQDSLDFTVSVTDTDKVGAITKVELIRGEVITILGNLTSHKITDLLSDNEYILRVTYTYDLNDGKGTQTITKEITAKTDAKAVPEISVNAPEKTQTSLGFNITESDKDNVGTVTKIELVHKNGTIVADSLDQRAFAGLLSNNAYTVKVTYVYNLNDGTGDKTVTEELVITTLSKAAPSFIITNTAKGQDNLDFTVSVTDTDKVGSITKIELIHGGEVVKELEKLTSLQIKDLLSDNAYTVRVTYSYDLNDGNGAQTLTKELTAKTVAKAVPTFTVKNESITPDSIKADYDITDADGILSSYKVELYQGDTLIKEGTDKKIDFSSLSYYTGYTVRFTFSYDLHDGNGEQTATSDKSYKTLPYIDVTECKIRNTSAVSEGDTIVMSVKLDNPLGMTVESVVINGETYSVSQSSNTQISVDIVYKGQFGGGDTYLKVDSLNARIDSTSLSVKPVSEIADNVFINGRVDVLSVEYVNEDFEVFENGSWVFPSEKINLLVTLSNPTGYTVDSLISSDFIKLDDNRYYRPCENPYDPWTGWSPQISISDISYHNEYISKEVDIADVNNTANVFRTCSDEIVYISTPDDLKNMYGHRYYELKNDIDLDGIEWQGNIFHGVLNGKGYSIKNMSFVKTVENSNISLGLFSEGDGIIEDLNIVDPYVRATLNATTGDGWSVAYFGGLIAQATDKAFIKNCEIKNAEIMITVSGNAASFAGGFIGLANHELLITDSESSGGISAETAGGMIGEAGWHSALYPPVRVVNSTNNANVSGNIAGGLIGIIRAGTELSITNSHNSGDVTAIATDLAFAGGLIGCSGTSVFVITSCTNSGNITASVTNSDARAGGICGSIGVDVKEINITDSSNSGTVTARAENESAYAGGAIGIAYCASALNLKECTNSGNVNAVSGAVGSVAGGLVGDSKAVDFKDCHNLGDINSESGGSGSSGGLVGNSENAVFKSCTNEGKISTFSKTSAYSFAGGLGGDSENAVLNNCRNSGDITIDTHADTYAGGLIARSFTVSFNNCENTGNINVTTTNNLTVGGIAGYGGAITVTDCTNSGFITVTGGYILAAGGLVGKNGSLDAEYASILNSSNSGDITATQALNSFVYTGGIIGQCESETVIEGSSNIGNVTVNASGTARSGGLVGEATDTHITIADSSNGGKVSSASANGNPITGGLIGDAYDATVKNCRNTGTVISKVTDITCDVLAGGLIGAASCSDITDSVNSGDVSALGIPYATTYAGGLFGQVGTNIPSSITGSANSGNISASSTVGFAHARGLIGKKIPGATVTVTNCVNTGRLTEEGVTVFGLVHPDTVTHYGENSYDLSTFGDYDGNKHIYTFITDSENTIPPIESDMPITLPTPEKDGWYFGGWYDNAEFAGYPVNKVYYSANANTLYAKWLTEEEYALLGSSFENAYTLSIGCSLEADIDTAGEYVFFSFTADESSYYTFSLSGSSTIFASLYSSKKHELINGYDLHISMGYQIEKGDTVYLRVRMNEPTDVGTVYVSVS